MMNKVNYSVIFLWIISGILFITLTNPIHKSTGDWSEPMLLYYHPGKYEVLRFDVDVNNGIINAAAAYSHSNNDCKMEYSGIYHILKEPGRDTEVERISQGDIPSESPSVFRDSSGKLHFFWGDRRQDPDFESWPEEWQQSGIYFSTDIMHYMPNNETHAEPNHIYTGNLGLIGRGDIHFPISITEDSRDRLHIAFSADSVPTTEKYGIY
jgi:hypothetical protein